MNILSQFGLAPSFSSASFASGADTEEPMADEATARAWLAQKGFAEGDLRSEITVHNYEWFPMLTACYEGELGVCKWLHNNGAAADITKAANNGGTPMSVS